MLAFAGGITAGPNSTSIPDWVDESVAQWLKSETAAMESAWGPAENRAALAFVHIPPHVASSLANDVTFSDARIGIM